jgi:hypothetical protein
MIYQLVASVLIPGKTGEYYEIANSELMPLYPKYGMKLAGSFRPVTGNMNEIYSLYVFDDLAAYQKAREAQQKDRDFLKVSAKLNALRMSMTHNLLELNPWSPAIEEKSEKHSIYTLVVSLLMPGKLGELTEISNKVTLPLFNKLGMKLAGSFHSYTGNMNEIYTFNKYSDIAAFQKVMEAQKNSKEWQSFNVKLNSIRISATMKIIEPNPWSPMK